MGVVLGRYTIAPVVWVYHTQLAQSDLGQASGGYGGIVCDWRHSACEMGNDGQLERRDRMGCISAIEHWLIGQARISHLTLHIRRAAMLRCTYGRLRRFTRRT
jgi:hypothetical protein